MPSFGGVRWARTTTSLPAQQILAWIPWPKTQSFFGYWLVLSGLNMMVEEREYTANRRTRWRTSETARLYNPSGLSNPLLRAGWRMNIAIFIASGTWLRLTLQWICFSPSVVWCFIKKMSLCEGRAGKKRHGKGFSPLSGTGLLAITVLGHGLF